MKRETLFLKVVIFLMSLPILALCIWGLPWLAKGMLETYPELSNVIYPLIMILYVSALPYYYALFQTFKLLSYIDRNEAFSDFSVKVLKKIKYSAITICFLYVVVLPLIYLVADASDAPGMILMGMGISFASLAVAVFAAVLEKLLKNAIELKSENELTV
jgi:hypothetical protein